MDGDALEDGVSPKRRDNSPTLGGDIFEDHVDGLMMNMKDSECGLDNENEVNILIA
jgi:hypothetical protein